jgi:hypothetical protein
MELNRRKSAKLKKRVLYTWEKFVQGYSKLSNKCLFGCSLLLEELFLTFSDRSIFLLQPFLM